MSGEPTELQPIDVIRAMRARGIDNAEELLQYAPLEAIRATCEWWDSKPGVGAGLLAKKIRQGGVELPPQPAPGAVEERLRATHDEYAQRFPVGSIAEPHARLQERRGYDDKPCPGSIIVRSHDYPVWIVECDGCDYDAGMTPRALRAVLRRRLEVVA
jgi:hypothetical protein